MYIVGLLLNEAIPPLLNDVCGALLCLFFFMSSWEKDAEDPKKEKIFHIFIISPQAPGSPLPSH